MTASRRNVIGGGLAAMAMTSAARADDGAKPPLVYRDTTPRAEALDTPTLKTNSLARSFKQPPADLIVPRVKIERASGIAEFRPQPGLTLISLWAPWCAPCLMELKDLAQVQKAYDGKRFRVLPILTGPRGDITMAEARAVLAKAGAEGLEVAIDRSPGSRALLETLTLHEKPGGGGLGQGLPCNLLVDGDGRVLGREFGAPLNFRLQPGQTPTPEMRANARTMWVEADGEVLLGALQRGEIAGAAQRRS